MSGKICFPLKKSSCTIKIAGCYLGPKSAVNDLYALNGIAKHLKRRLADAGANFIFKKDVVSHKKGAF